MLMLLAIFLFLLKYSFIYQDFKENVGKTVTTLLVALLAPAEKNVINSFMRLRELIENLIDEAATADLYHGTSLIGALQVLKTDVIKGFTAIHSDQIPKTVKGHARTVSLTRNLEVAKTFAKDKAYMWADLTGVVLVIDQDKLRRDLGKRLRPYDDTSTAWYRKQAGITHTRSLRPTSKTETEETVFGDILNANRYIKSIIVLPPVGDNKEAKVEEIRKTGIFNDPRTAKFIDYDPSDYKEYKKELVPKYFLRKVGISDQQTDATKK